MLKRAIERSRRSSAASARCSMFDRACSRSGPDGVVCMALSMVVILDTVLPWLDAAAELEIWLVEAVGAAFNGMPAGWGRLPQQAARSTC